MRYLHQFGPVLEVPDVPLDFAVNLYASWALERDQVYTTASRAAVMHPFALCHIRAGSDVTLRLQLVEKAAVSHAQTWLEYLIRKLAQEGADDRALIAGEP